jgi:integrase
MRGMGLRPPFKIGTSPNWYYEINRQRRSLRTSNKAEALRLYNEIKRQYLAGKYASLTGECSVSLREFADEYGEWSEFNRASHTRRADMLALAKLIEVAGNSVRLDRLGLKDADKMITACRKRKLKPSSINNYLRHLRSVFNKSIEWGYLMRNPFRGVKELKVERKPPAFLTREQVARVMMSVKDNDLRALIMAYLATGRRRNELLALTWEDIDEQGNKYFVRKSKTHLCKWYPISPTFKAILNSLPKNKGRVFSRWQHPDTISHNVKKRFPMQAFLPCGCMTCGIRLQAFL